MGKTVKRKKQSPERLDMPQLPFDDALRKILSAPHQPNIRKKSKRALSKRTK